MKINWLILSSQKKEKTKKRLEVGGRFNRYNRHVKAPIVDFKNLKIKICCLVNYFILLAHNKHSKIVQLILCHEGKLLILINEILANLVNLRMTLGIDNRPLIIQTLII